MSRPSISRRTATAAASAALAMAAVAALASPASASTGFSGNGGAVFGTITHNSTRQVTVSGNIYGDSSAPGYEVLGQYAVGNGEYTCYAGPTRVSRVDDGRAHRFTDTVTCSGNNVNRVVIVYYRYGSPTGEASYG